MKPAIFIKPRRKTLGFQPWGARCICLDVRFQLLLPEPCLHLSTHTALQGCDLTSQNACTIWYIAGTCHSLSPALLPRVSGITPII